MQPSSPVAESLRELAADLVDGAYADRERAVAILSGLTIYLENHAAILKSEVLPALMNVVSNPKAEGTVSGLRKADVVQDRCSTLCAKPTEPSLCLCSWSPHCRAAVHTALLCVISNMH